MLLKSILLKNFRQFKGEQKIDFSCDDDQNVTVILGENTSGKTTIVQAFTWALYDISNFENHEVLNKEVEKEMMNNDTAHAEVEICLNHDNTDYIITRSKKYEGNNKGAKVKETKFKVSYKQEDGQIETIRASAVESTINKILPQDLSSYFFFDGERISNINNKQDVTEAVKGLMGLSVLSNTMYHLKPSRKNSVIGIFKNSLDVGGNEKANEAKKQIEKLQNRCEQINAEIASKKTEIDYYKRKKERLEQILQNNQSIASLQKKKMKLEHDIKNEQKALDEAEKRLRKEFNSNVIGFFSQPLVKRAKELLHSSSIEDRGIPNMNQNSIDYIIKRGSCICGATIEKNNGTYNQIIREREFLPPQAIGTMIRHFLGQTSLYESSSENYFDNLKSVYEEIYRCKNRIQDWNDELEEISNKIAGKEDIGKHELDLKDVKNRLAQFEDEKDKLIKEYGGCENEIEKYEKIYDSYATASEKNQRIKQYIKYAEAIYEWIKETYDRKERELREQVETKVNGIFSKMYHGERKVIIDDKYRIRLLTAYGDEDFHTDESTGLAKVKNFAFIAGLVDLARDKIVDQSGEEEIVLSSEPYPLVMDAPFSAVDKRHISNISVIFPEIAEQVIMLLLEEHWNFTESTMGEKVGKKYYLDKKSETFTYLKELN